VSDGDQAGTTDASAGGAADDGGTKGKNLVLAAMIFAVSMTFIDMTIVSIAIPEVQKELGLSATGVQWVINAYLLSLAALFAFGGRIGDMFGHKKMVLIGVVVFAAASTMCGLTPTGDAAEPWIIVFRAVQGLGAALMFPAALAIVVASFPFSERGKAMAIFFAVAGGLTAVGPLLGGYLSEWTWRSIFWVNVPVAIIAVILTLKSKPTDTSKPSKLDVPGLLLIVLGMGLSVLGFQQASSWGWTSPLTIGCIVVGLAVLVVFVWYEHKPESPLINLAIFRVRAFFVQNVVLFVTMMAFIPVFFFASMYAQISLGSDSSEAGLYLLTFFAGYAPAAQVGGRMLDSIGAKRPVVLGCVLAAVGFYLWAGELTDISGGLNSQWYWIVLTGAGMGLMLGPANTDAINRAPSDAYGEATGITQTVRNYGSSVGMAVLGTILINSNRTNIEGSLTSLGLSKDQADEVAQSLSQAGGGDSSQLSSHASSSQVAEVFKAVQGDFAQSIETVFYGMAIVMAVGAVIALVGLDAGKQEGIVEALPGDDPAPAPKI
jgi:EmrB/QacA subfamily drug resistance transporter